MIGQGPVETAALADVDQGKPAHATPWRQHRGAAESRAHDAPVAEGRRYAVNHDAAAAPARDLNLKVEGRGLAECLERKQPERLAVGGRSKAAFKAKGRKSYLSSVLIVHQVSGYHGFRIFGEACSLCQANPGVDAAKGG